MLPRWDLEADVLIAGLGAAGACAAIEAAEAGADVLVLERTSAGGGTSATSSGQLYIGGGTPLQRACGFDDDPEQMFRYMAATLGPGADEAKIRFYCQRSLAHYHWLVERGVPFKMSYLDYREGTDPRSDDGLSFTGSELAHPYPQLARPAPRGHNVQQVGSDAGARLMQALLARVEQLRVRVQPDTRVRSLVMDEERRVVGCRASCAGRELAVRARRGLILATGGFTFNREMLQLYAPLLAKLDGPAGTPYDDGSGILLGIGAGAAAIHMDAGCIVAPFSPPRQLLCVILINRFGQRFINEDVYQTLAGEACVLRQEGRAWLIVDDAIYARSETREVPIAAVGETPAQLEAALGLPAGSLQHTLAHDNEHAARGEDPIFHKSPDWLRPLRQAPLAALDLTVDTGPYPFFTLGGLRAAISGAVLTPGGEAIPGLFAAGRTTSGLAARGYNSGPSLADATFFGRMAGRSAAGKPCE